MSIELFPCSGGMAEGFRRAGVTFDIAFDVDADACASYEANLGHRPIQMDARDLLRMVRAGWQPAEYHGINPLTRTIAQPLDLLVADPPCTPWSRAGKRLGVEDERDMLLVTIELIRLLRPRAYLIGNVPGLGDAPNWPIVQRALAPLVREGYCIADYAALDAANYGDFTPCPIHDFTSPISDAAAAASASRLATRRDCVVGRATTPGAADERSRVLAVAARLAKAIRAACAVDATPLERLRSLQLLALAEQPTQHGEAGDGWTSEGMSAFGVDDGTIESIASWLRASWDDLSQQARWSITSTETPPTTIRGIWRSIAATGTTSPIIDGEARQVACTLCLDEGVPQHRVRPFWFGHLDGPCIRWPAPTHGDPADPSVHSPLPGLGLKPWVTCRDALGHLPPEDLGRPVRLRHRDQHSPQHGSVPDRPARVVGTSNLSDGNVLLRNGKHPTNQLDAPSYTVTAKGDCRGAQGACVLDLAGPAAKPKRPPSTKCPQWARTASPDEPSPTVLTDTDRRTGNGIKLDMRSPDPNRPPVPADVPHRSVTGARDQSLLEWPWDRPAAAVMSDPRIPPPGHHDEQATRTMPDAIVLSERAAAILQGFPDGWTFAGATKKSRWSQLGQAMPPPLAEAVARAVVAQMAAAKGRAA